MNCAQTHRKNGATHQGMRPTAKKDSSCRIQWLLGCLAGEICEIAQSFGIILGATDLGHDRHVLPRHDFIMFDFELKVGQKKMQFGNIKIGAPPKVFFFSLGFGANPHGQCEASTAD